jgi:hypothetical protein
MLRDAPLRGAPQHEEGKAHAERASAPSIIATVF